MLCTMWVRRSRPIVVPFLVASTTKRPSLSRDALRLIVMSSQGEPRLQALLDLTRAGDMTINQLTEPAAV
jgi:hypothetical protein